MIQTVEESSSRRDPFATPGLGSPRTNPFATPVAGSSAASVVHQQQSGTRATSVNHEGAWSCLSSVFPFSGHSSSQYYAVIAPRRRFRSSRLKGELEKPWLNKSKREVNWDSIIFYVCIFIGLGRWSPLQLGGGEPH